jgi:hypothetical protein
MERCYQYVCFIPLDGSAPKFFGFTEFLAGLALMVLAWTIADVRYRFRIKTAPIPLQELTFVVVAAVGVLTLLTDLWRAEQWMVPKGTLLTPAEWQAILAAVYLITFLTWAWYAFIRPNQYSKWNSERYAKAVYRTVLKGDTAEMAVIADEITSSARALVGFATDRGEWKSFPQPQGRARQDTKPPERVTAYANDLLLLIADRRFCGAIVASSPGTALAIFQEIGRTKKYGIQVEVFARNIVSEAIANTASFLFQEGEGYQTGLMGYHKPLSQAMFKNYRMVEVIGTLLDPDYSEMSKWDAAQWRAYCRVALITLRDYADQGERGHSFVLYRAKGYIERSASDLYKLDGMTSNTWASDVQERLQVAVKFIADAIEILNEKGKPDFLILRVRAAGARSLTVYDYLAEMILEVVLSASAIRSPTDWCWGIQHNTVWHELFNFGKGDGEGAKVVQFKARRLMYDQIIKMSKFPNFQGARVLRFCLNVMGLKMNEQEYGDDSRALQKAVLSWTKKNFAWLYSYNPRVAEACLVDGMTYDATRRRIIRTYPVDGLRREPSEIYLDVDEPKATSE